MNCWQQAEVLDHKNLADFLTMGAPRQHHHMAVLGMTPCADVGGVTEHRFLFGDAGFQQAPENCPVGLIVDVPHQLASQVATQIEVHPGASQAISEICTVRDDFQYRDLRQPFSYMCRFERVPPGQDVLTSALVPVMQ